MNTHYRMKQVEETPKFETQEALLLDQIRKKEAELEQLLDQVRMHLTLLRETSGNQPHLARVEPDRWFRLARDLIAQGVMSLKRAVSG